MYKLDTLNHIEDEGIQIKQTILNVDLDKMDKLQEMFIKLGCFFGCSNSTDNKNLNKLHMGVY